jgi:hypothetical protein
MFDLLSPSVNKIIVDVSSIFLAQCFKRTQQPVELDQMEEAQKIRSSRRQGLRQVVVVNGIWARKPVGELLDNYPPHILCISVHHLHGPGSMKNCPRA